MAGAGTVDEVVGRLEELQRSLRPTDGVRWFNRLYLEVTLAVRDYLRDHRLQAPPFLERLDVSFSNAYFAAFDAAQRGRQPIPRAWAPLFELRREGTSRRSSSRWPG